jgi:hypothetical protein
MNTAYCGLVCESCLIHAATLETDAERKLAMRLTIAEECNRLYGTFLKACDINGCDGCRADSGRLFSGCRNCEIRKCASIRKVENCAHCSDYACGILERHFLLDPGAKNRLEEIYNTINSSGM